MSSDNKRIVTVSVSYKVAKGGYARDTEIANKIIKYAQTLGVPVIFNVTDCYDEKSSKQATLEEQIAVAFRNWEFRFQTELTKEEQELWVDEGDNCKLNFPLSEIPLLTPPKGAVAYNFANGGGEEVIAFDKDNNCLGYYDDNKEKWVS